MPLEAEKQDAPRLIKVKAAAAILSVSPAWIRARRNELGFVVEIAPTELRVDYDRMMRWIERRRLRP
jgi:hypothetical protein